MTTEERAAIESIRAAIVLSPYDWAAHRKLAWVYGIIVGWSESSLAELAKKYNWTEENIALLRQFRNLLQDPGTASATRRHKSAAATHSTR